MNKLGIVLHKNVNTINDKDFNTNSIKHITVFTYTHKYRTIDYNKFGIKIIIINKK